MQFDPSQLAALAAVLRLGSFDAAAHALSVTPSAISQRIKALEEKAGGTLIHRATPCTGTEAGLRIAKHAEDIGLLEAHLARDLSLGSADAPARLRIAVTADSVATWFVEAMAACDGVLFDLVLDDQDHSADWLKRGEVSAAVTAHGRAVAGCDSHPLGEMHYIATASPAFMTRWFPDGVTPAAAARAPCLVFNAKDGLQRLWLETHVGPRLSPPAHFMASSQAFVDAARAGIGWGMNPEQLVRRGLRRGKLVALLPDTALSVPLSWQVSRIMAPALAPVTAAVLQSAQRNLPRTAPKGA